MTFNPKRPHLEMAPGEVRRNGHPYICKGHGPITTASGDVVFRSIWRQALPAFTPAPQAEAKLSAVSISYEKLFINEKGEDPRQTGRWYRAGKYDDNGEWTWNPGWDRHGFHG